MSAPRGRRVIVGGAGAASGTLNDRFTQMKEGGKVGITSPGFKRRSSGGTSITITRDNHDNRVPRGGRGGIGGGARGRGGREGRGGRGGRGGRFKKERTPTQEELDAELDQIRADNQMSA